MDKFVVRKKLSTVVATDTLDCKLAAINERESDDSDTQVEAAELGHMLVDSAFQDNPTATTLAETNKHRLSTGARTNGITKKPKYYCKYTQTIKKKCIWTSRSTKKVCDINMTAKRITCDNYNYVTIIISVIYVKRLFLWLTVGLGTSISMRIVPPT